MKPYIRKLGDPIPVALLIKPDGTLVLADGGDVKTYLAAVYQNGVKLGNVNGEPMEVCVIERFALARLEQDSWLHRNHSA